MPTQEEVLNAIKIQGWATYPQLRKIFKILCKGSSSLPQRLRALSNRNQIVRMKTEIGTVFVAVEDQKPL